MFKLFPAIAGIPLKSVVAAILRVFDPSSLFSSGDDGVWFDVSDVKPTWRTNLLTWTEDFNHSNWTKTNITPEQVSGPVWRIRGDTTSGLHYMYHEGPSITYVRWCIDVKAESGCWIMFGESAQTGNLSRFNPNTGAFIDNSSNLKVTNLGDGWYRLHLKVFDDYPNALGTYCIGVMPVNAAAGTGSYVMSNSDSILIRYPIVQKTKETVANWNPVYQKITDGIQDYYTYQPLPILYQDIAGTIPCTAVEQPVALMLDKSKGLVLGPEKMVNGNFSNGTTGWTSSGSTISVENGRLKIESPGGVFPIATQTISTVVGKTYLVTGEYDKATSNKPPYISPRSSFDIIAPSTAGKITFIFVANNVNTTITIGHYATTAATGYVYFDNISVRELPGNHATQSISTARGILRARYNLFTYSEDFSNAAWNKNSITLTPQAIIDGIPGIPTLMSSNLTWNNHGLGQISLSLPVTALCLSVYAKAGGSSTLFITSWDGIGSPVACTIDLGNQSYTGLSGTNVEIISKGNGWYKYSIYFSKTDNRLMSLDFMLSVGPSQDARSIYIAAPQLTIAQYATLPYQRIGSATDYDADPTKFPPYLYLDGVDDFMTLGDVLDLQLSSMTTCISARIEKIDSTLIAKSLSGGQPNRYALFALTQTGIVTFYNNIMSPSVFNLTFKTNVYTSVIDRSGLISLEVDNSGKQYNGYTADENADINSSFRFLIGAYNDSTDSGVTLPMKGCIYQIMLFKRLLSTQETANVKTYLAAKAGITL